jgi:hypothetical protein
MEGRKHSNLEPSNPNQMGWDGLPERLNKTCIEILELSVQDLCSGGHDLHPCVESSYRMITCDSARCYLKNVDYKPTNGFLRRQDLYYRTFIEVPDADQWRLGGSGTGLSRFSAQLLFENIRMWAFIISVAT